MAETTTYAQQRERLRDYFDRTASETWARLTSDAPVSRIRETVRAGRAEMRETLLSWLPEDLSGRRLLDAGCGTGALTLEAARRGAEVVAVDVAGSLLSVAAERTPAELRARITWQTGDMLDPGFGAFDHVVAMDSLVHYGPRDIVGALGQLAARTRHSVVFTFAPRTPLLAAMHTAGKLFPRSDRSPAIQPIGERRLHGGVRSSEALDGWVAARSARVSRGFYISHGLELVHP
ncbi:MAG: magnesium protoporphyrin IX methyltransferase [Pseudomonadota bacterium]